MAAGVDVVHGLEESEAEGDREGLEVALYCAVFDALAEAQGLGVAVPPQGGEALCDGLPVPERVG